MREALVAAERGAGDGARAVVRFGHHRRPHVGALSEADDLVGQLAALDARDRVPALRLLRVGDLDEVRRLLGHLGPWDVRLL